MGTQLSSVFAPPPVPQPPTSHNGGPHFILPLPPEADTMMRYYTDFWERAFCAHHRDGKNIIICWPNDKDALPERDDEHEDGWAIKRLRSNYELLRGDHPRIVRYVGALSDGSLVVEKLLPGPLFCLKLPDIQVPEFDAKRRKTMLCLYYRWALQALSALEYFHSQHMYLRTFGERMVWLRADYSIAITGFISAIKDQGTVAIQKGAEEIQVPSWSVVDPEGGLKWAPITYHQIDEWIEFEENLDRLGNPLPCAKADLFQWATFTWRLMTSGMTGGPQICQEHPSQMKNGLVRNCSEGPYNAIFDEIDPRLYRNLDEDRMGSVLARAWNGQYESAAEVSEQVRLFASNVGISAVGDEVEIEGGWENVFELVDMGDPFTRALRFRSEY